MKTRLLTSAFLVIVSGFVFTSCSKEKIQRNASSAKVSTSNTKSTESTTPTSNSDETNAMHSGCSHGG